MCANVMHDTMTSRIMFKTYIYILWKKKIEIGVFQGCGCAFKDSLLLQVREFLYNYTQEGIFACTATALEDTRKSEDN